MLLQGKKSKQGTFLNTSKLLKMNRKTTDGSVGASSVSRVRIFNANSDRFEAPLGRHSVQQPQTDADVSFVCSFGP